MKNKLADLNDHLFAQIQRLSVENLTPEQIDHEHKRGQAIVALSEQVIKGAALQIEAARLVAGHGHDPMLLLPEMEGRKQIKQITNDRQ
jgi:hypothetical protein